MLEIKVATKDELLEIKKLLKENHLDTKEIEETTHYMIAYDDKKTVAAAGFTDVDHRAILNFVVVKKDRQREYLGEGIVKATLNLIDKRNITSVLVVTDEQSLFFERIGFKTLDMERTQDLKEIIPDKSLKGHKVLEVLLPDYFQNPCKSKRRV